MKKKHKAAEFEAAALEEILRQQKLPLEAMSMPEVRLLPSGDVALEALALMPRVVLDPKAMLEDSTPEGA